MDVAVVIESGAPLTLALAFPVTSDLYRGRRVFVRTVSDRHGADSFCLSTILCHTETHTYTNTQWKGCPQPSAPQIQQKKNTKSLSIKRQQSRLLSDFIAPSVPGSCCTDSSAAFHTTPPISSGLGSRSVSDPSSSNPVSKDKPHPRASPPAHIYIQHKTKNIHFDGPQMKALVLTEGHAFGGKVQKYIYEAQNVIVKEKKRGNGFGICPRSLPEGNL